MGGRAGVGWEVGSGVGARVWANCRLGCRGLGVARAHLFRVSGAGARLWVTLRKVWGH